MVVVLQAQDASRGAQQGASRDRIAISSRERRVRRKRSSGGGMSLASLCSAFFFLCAVSGASTPQSWAAPSQPNDGWQQGRVRPPRPLRIPARPLRPSQAHLSGAGSGSAPPLWALRRAPKGPGRGPERARSGRVPRGPGPSKDLTPGPRLLKDNVTWLGPVPKKDVFVHPKDAAILLQAAAAWTSSANDVNTWKKNAPCSQWIGVVCDSTTSRVVSLKVLGRAIMGPIPSSFGNLLSLRWLDLTYCSLGGSIPDQLGNLVNLQYLGLQGNKLQGPLPGRLSKLGRLDTLNVGGNELGGSIPDWISSLSSLSVLGLDRCNLSGPLPASLGSLTGLVRLNLAGNSLDGSLPDELGNLTSLQFFSAFDNQLSGSIPATFSGLTGLYFLSLSNNLLSGSLPRGLSSMKSLAQLNLQGCFLTGSIPEELANLQTLVEMNLKSNFLSGSIPSELARLTALQSLELSDNRLVGTLPAALTNLRKLESLTVSVNGLTGSIPDQIAQMRHLQILLVDSNQFTGSIPSYRTTEYPYGNYTNNFFSNGTCAPGNCLPARCRNQRLVEECLGFCNSTGPRGPCGGKGRCSLAGPNAVPACSCARGFVAPAYNPGTCVANSTRAPPSPPEPKGSFPTGLSLGAQGAGPSLNKWSRYLSSQASAWDFVLVWDPTPRSSAFAPPTTFISFNASRPLGLLRWGAPRNQLQGTCASSWAAAAADSIAAAAAIGSSHARAEVAVAQLSAAQLLRCSGRNGSTGAGTAQQSCPGGTPVMGLEYSAQHTVLPEKSFTQASSCPATSVPSPSLVMYEAVQFRSWFGLLLTLSSQPAVVILQGSSQAFQRPPCTNQRLVFADPSCYTGSLDHSVVVVGYELAALTPYWVVRNSWGTQWCTGGYMRMAIQGGAGVCGINAMPAYYPIPAPLAGDPCYTQSWDMRLNPCGGGMCIPAPQWGPYSYTCDCTMSPSYVPLMDFVAANNTVTIKLPDAGLGITQTCVAVDACRKGLFNPCGTGTCVNDGSGGYSCICPPGFSPNTFVDGQQTCTYSGPSGATPLSYVVPPGATCDLIRATFQLKRAELLRLNPGLNCAALKPQQRVKVTNPAYNCSVGYTVTEAYRTCEEITKNVLALRDQSVDVLQTLNPSIDCSPGARLPLGLLVCIKGGAWAAQPQQCTWEVPLGPSQTCAHIASRYLQKDPAGLYALNPGILCDLLQDPSGGAPGVRIGPVGGSVCVAAQPAMLPNCFAVPGKAKLYRLAMGDDCPGLLQRPGLKFRSIQHIEQMNQAQGFKCFPKRVWWERPSARRSLMRHESAE